MTPIFPKIAARKMVLATDLDGTFLGGSDDDRRALYGWIEENRATVGLVFVTGRDLEFICQLCHTDEVPWPEYIIGDVGTTIAEITNRSIKPMVALEAEISALWQDKGDVVRSTLDGHPGLTLQPTAFRYRVSYDYDPHTFDDSALGKIDALGADVLISNDQYFDVLPKGVSKGPSLLRFLDNMNVSRDRVLAAGDTLNDLSLLLAGTPAVAVGGSEQALLDALPEDDRIHRARAIGAAGITEAIAAFNLHSLEERIS